MKSNYIFGKPLAAIAVSLLLLAVVPAWAADGVVEGPVVTRDGNNVVVRTETGDVNLTVNEQTYIGESQGVLFFLSDTSNKNDLVPGLNIRAETATNGNQTIA